MTSRYKVLTLEVSLHLYKAIPRNKWRLKQTRNIKPKPNIRQKDLFQAQIKLPQDWQVNEATETLMYYFRDINCSRKHFIESNKMFIYVLIHNINPRYILQDTETVCTAVQ